MSNDARLARPGITVDCQKERIIDLFLPSPPELLDSFVSSRVCLKRPLVGQQHCPEQFVKRERRTEVHKTDIHCGRGMDAAHGCECLCVPNERLWRGLNTGLL